MVVHILMIVGVGAYAVLGAVIIRQIESRSYVTDVTSISSVQNHVREVRDYGK